MSNKRALLTVVAIIIISSILPAVFTWLHLPPNIYIVLLHLAFIIVSLSILKGLKMIREKKIWRILRNLLWGIRATFITATCTYLSISLVVGKIDVITYLYDNRITYGILLLSLLFSWLITTFVLWLTGKFFAKE